MDIGRRIRAARKSAGISQEELARRAGMSLKGMGDIERGDIEDPHYSSLSKIAAGLGVRISELLELTPQVNPKYAALVEAEAFRTDVVLASGAVPDPLDEASQESGRIDEAQAALHMDTEVDVEVLRNEMKEDREPINRSKAMAFAQALLARQENAGLSRLMERQPDEVAGALVEAVRGYEHKIEELRAEHRLTKQKLAEVEEELALARARLAEGAK